MCECGHSFAMVHVWPQEDNPEELAGSLLPPWVIRLKLQELLATGPFHWLHVLLSHVLLQKQRC